MAEGGVFKLFKCGQGYTIKGESRVVEGVGDWEEGGEGSCVPPAHELWDQDQLLKECKKLAIPVSDKDLLVMVHLSPRCFFQIILFFLSLLVSWGSGFLLCPTYIPEIASGFSFRMLASGRPSLATRLCLRSDR